MTSSNTTRNSSLRFAFTNFLVCVLIWGVAGCLGGGTSGTGLGFSGGAADVRDGFVQYTLRGHISYQSGLAAAQTQVTFRSAATNTSLLTDDSGAFSQTIKQKLNEALDVTVTLGNLRWATKLPATRQREVTLKFILLDNGSMLIK